jgi:hypothetical protein
MTDLPDSSALVRTWFGDDTAWDSLVTEVQTPSADGFLAYVTLVNDPAFAGLTADALTTGHPAGAFVSFLADQATLTSAEHPILAVWIYDDRPDHEPFRVVPAAMWSVENNINIANMDWPEFTRSVDEDGVFRGF